MDDTKIAEDCLTKILYDSLLFGTIAGVVVDWDKNGQKYYGLRITKGVKSNPKKYHEYVIWFIADFEGNGPGGFQLQEI